MLKEEVASQMVLGDPFAEGSVVKASLRYIVVEACLDEETLLTVDLLSSSKRDYYLLNLIWKLLKTPIPPTTMTIFYNEEISLEFTLPYPIILGNKDEHRDLIDTFNIYTDNISCIKCFIDPEELLLYPNLADDDNIIEEVTMGSNQFLLNELPLSKDPSMLLEEISLEKTDTFLRMNRSILNLLLSSDNVLELEVVI